MRNFFFVLGPTASGKSEWAMEEAFKNNGVIFNCDSIQLYQEVNIGAAKPSAEDRKKIPHYLLDQIQYPEEITSAGYRKIFFNEMAKIPESVPIYVVGGTGFYFLALEKGLYEIEQPSLELKTQIEKEGSSDLGISQLLQEVIKADSEYAAKLHLHDRYRIMRAVQILRSNPGKKITKLLAEKKETKGLQGNIKKIGLKWDSSVLEERIRIRTRRMLENGLIDETQDLLKRGFGNWTPLKSVGYREVVQFLKGELPRNRLEEQIVIATRQLAKKQRTWFQRDSDIQWMQKP